VPDIFEKLPWRTAILEGMLNHDIVGFQTERDRRNFVACVRALLPSAKIAADRISLAGHTCHFSVFPISIDHQEFAQTSLQPNVVAHATRIKDEQSGRQLILGVDRLDYTKGIVERLLAFRHLLTNSPELHRAISLIQVVVPSRADIPKYRELKQEVERLVSEINGHFSDRGWIPIVYLYRHLSREELVAYYRAADIALVTPLKDGMNLVAKEYCASQVEHRGVLVLSEFAGAATELKCGALLVNPNDQQAIADALITAYRMSLGERKQRMQGLRTTLQHNDVFGWAESFLSAGREMLSKPRRPVITDVRTSLTRAAGVN
jgi:trehalose 6-phosphate synthase